jgi:hypothetical protein
MAYEHVLNCMLSDEGLKFTALNENLCETETLPGHLASCFENDSLRRRVTSLNSHLSNCHQQTNSTLVLISIVLYRKVPKMRGGAGIWQWITSWRPTLRSRGQHFCFVRRGLMFKSRARIPRNSHAPKVVNTHTVHWRFMLQNSFMQFKCPTVHYSTLQYTKEPYRTLHYATVHYSTIQHTTVPYCIVQYTTVHYSTLRYPTVHQSTLQNPTLR